MMGFCLGFRNWSLEHLQRCLASIRSNTIAPIIVTDLGSDEGLIRFVRQTVDKAGGRLLSEPAQEWSRSRALNLAARAQSPEVDWLVCTDADMLFPSSWFPLADLVATTEEERKLWLTRSRDLDQLATESLPMLPFHPSDAWLWESSAPHGNDLGQGAAMLIPRDWFERVGGFDEYYTVWGCEDNDLTLRAQWSGCPVDWLPLAWVAHQWHPRDWPTPTQFEQVRRNREYLYQRMVDRGPVVRNG